ncbi:MAG: hypothetical protein JW904_00830 [Spirochaetales bacterium]|nr:hypothetical protein [Spirochaetales bacterium]
MRNRVFFLLPLLLIAAFMIIPATALHAETFDEYRERTKKEQEENKENHEVPNQQDDDNKNSGNFCNSILKMLQCLSEIGSNSSDDDSSDSSTGSTTANKDQGSCILSDSESYLSISEHGAYLFGQDYSIYSATTMVNASFSFIHLNFYYALIGNELGELPLNSLSFNAGVSIPFNNFHVNLYGGFFSQVDVQYFSFSFGASTVARLTPNILAEFYSLFSFKDTVWYIILSTSIMYKFDFFVLGVGFDFNNYNDLIMYGPTIKAGFWF